jgi:acetate kinase
LVMGSRSGDIDPAIIPYLERVADITTAEIDQSLNKNAGLLGMTGDSDLRDVEARAATGDQVAIEALEVYAQRIKHYIGAYLAEIGTIDAIVFTAGVGENSVEMRAQVLDGLGHLGIHMDSELNSIRDQSDRLISASGTPVLIIPTNEELEIALQSERFI